MPSLSCTFFKTTFSAEELSPKYAVSRDSVNSECQETGTDQYHKKGLPTLP